MKGRIIELVSRSARVLLDDGLIVLAKMSGKLGLSGRVLVGDRVELYISDEHYVIDKFYERDNELLRPKISNVDVALVVVSWLEPDFNQFLLDKLLVLIENSHVVPIIIFTKTDLVIDFEYFAYVKELYSYIGYLVVDSHNGDDLELLFAYLENKIAIVVGDSGVGKSTFLNLLDKDLELKTQEISKALNRGKHTTTKTILYRVKNFYVADSPGFSSLSLNYMSKIDILYGFREMRDYECYFKDCLHYHEPKCLLKLDLELGKINNERYNNYLRLLEEIK